MKRTAKKIIVAAAVTAISFSSVPTVQACGGGGRSRISRPSVGFGYGLGFNRPSVSHARPSAYSTARPTTYTTPRYQQPVYQQPTYSQPTYSQQTFTPAIQSSPVVTSRPVAVQTAAAIKQPAINQPAVQSQPVVQAKPAAVAPTQLVSAAPAKSTAAKSIPSTTANAEASALAMLASLASDAKTEQPTEQVAAKQVDAGIPQFAPVSASSANPSQAVPGHIGSWTAVLPSKVIIQLQLGNDGTFRWSVKNNGTATEFSGQYRITDGRLTLVRSNDLQQMAGNWSADGNGFTFKLDGANNAGLNFKKA